MPEIETEKWLENLKNAVVRFLVSEHDLLMDDAISVVDESVMDAPDLWNENSDAEELAKYLASDEDEE